MNVVDLQIFRRELSIGGDLSSAQTDRNEYAFTVTLVKLGPRPRQSSGIVGRLDLPAELKFRADAPFGESACFSAVSKLYLKQALGLPVGRRADSLLERLRKRETEWKAWKGASRAQGRCATRLPGEAASLASLLKRSLIN